MPKKAVNLLREPYWESLETETISREILNKTKQMLNSTDNEMQMLGVILFHKSSTLWDLSDISYDSPAHSRARIIVSENRLNYDKRESERGNVICRGDTASDE